MKGLEWLKHMFLVDDKPHAEPRRTRRGRRWRKRHPARRGTRCAVCENFVPYSEAAVRVKDGEKQHVCIEHGKPVSGPSETAVAREKLRRRHAG